MFNRSFSNSLKIIVILKLTPKQEMLDLAKLNYAFAYI
jgi:hypothetical protein